MKNMTLKRNDELNLTELNDLLRTNNWQIDPFEKLEKCIQSSWGWVTARSKENQLTAFVQVISDGIFHAYICRMIVHPDFRNRGIGSLVMTELMSMLRENNLKPTLAATPGNAKFYEKFGFQTTSKEITAMCIR
jgi:ribosomal protein S18 acetylase RimI-like enzyme